MLPGFKEAVVTVDLAQPGRPGLYAPVEPIATVHDALVLGLKDYLGSAALRKPWWGSPAGWIPR